jgi:hypothetical protein
MSRRGFDRAFLIEGVFFLCRFIQSNASLRLYICEVYTSGAGPVIERRKGITVAIVSP